MTRRILRSIMLTVTLTLLLTAGLIVSTLYNAYEGRISAELRSEASAIVRALDMMPDDLSYLSALEPINRITLIAPDGSVCYDSAASTADMDSHAERPEVAQALQNGSGESRRYSSTLSETTIYYAYRTARGNVLRLASTRSSMLGVFLNVTPQLLGMLLGILVLSLVIARHSARQIVAPLNSLNLNQPLNNEVYDELAPLLTRMDTQRVQINQQIHDLARAHSELTAIMKNMREGLVLMDSQGSVLSINDSAATIFGMTGEEAVGSDLLTFCREASVLEAVRGAQKGQAGDTLLKREGHTYRILASPVVRAQEMCGVVLLALDVTAHFAAEASRREFTANVSHELKTPLTSISGYAEIIQSGIAKAEDIPAFAGKICAEARRLMALVDDILQLSRLDERQGLGPRETMALAPMLETLTESFAPLAQQRDIQLSFTGTPASIIGYPVLLRELFHNLIDNALKYTPPGGTVSVSLQLQEGHAVCTVEDTGIGIPPEHQAHVFERFYRVDKSHSRQTGGTGLGLAIVKHVADVHHAAVTLESAVGKGTKITVAFE